MNYADTGILIKSYVEEVNSCLADSILRSLRAPFFYSHLHEIEIPNAIRLKVFRGEFSQAQSETALLAFRSDIDSGRLERFAYDLAGIFSSAERLSLKHSARIGARSMDLLHIAAAIEIGCSHFASFDKRQRECAALEGLTIHPAQ
jgi:predicted nucleic acid-binding protein